MFVGRLLYLFEEQLFFSIALSFDPFPLNRVFDNMCAINKEE